MTNVPARTRSVYRAILRELPSRPRFSPSPLQTKIRQHLSSAPADADAARAQLEEAEQFAQYVKAQRQYVTLLERYNPGADMDQEERVRLTARRVGMSLPIEHKNGSS
ncbi:hypothetical protein H112_03473 [Trichophyton rubrum D6]|uniref:Ras guanyl-nucleotide exchange factor RasGEF n=5 Tax=Trichophyton TaxID=5550 RepID=A0A178EXJ5_TRIRU|nr:uncharacterized protein TERG_04794 [Trichophyton rubrum CBS 118892]EZF23917.1 hypothetical protein H100_03477 [Trichophyton rubrum MR850]EZF43004.1 hypothetical protein H102_03472 [Trichophyton rubrum CBS 100081]EZF53604.1 hypothetical protein H103_03482 [Trichophyton rubrum CBS 288.86]EZF64272.1 hypothetical protein H104_03467 [Trichophyton rubrum CBS 289.86]EZF74810.1 hypothetical protein H105_03494 [Trichophyton soudanense CBS 452.61]EZF85567.1 hypothetical protein H110_03478 [Trichophy